MRMCGQTDKARYHVSCHEVQSTGQERHPLISAMMPYRKCSIPQIQDREETPLLYTIGGLVGAMREDSCTKSTIQPSITRYFALLWQLT